MLTPRGATRTARFIHAPNSGHEPVTFVFFQRYGNKSFSPTAEFIHSLRSLKSTIQTPCIDCCAYLGLQFLNLCFCNCMFDLQLKIEKKEISELRKSIYIFQVSATRRISRCTAEGLEKCCQAAGCKLKCPMRKMTY